MTAHRHPPPPKRPPSLWEWAAFVLIVFMLALLIGCLLAATGCATPAAVSIARAPSEAKIAEANAKLKDGIAGGATVIDEVNATNPEGPAKAVIAGEAGLILKATGKPTAEGLESARERAELAKTDLKAYANALTTKDREIDQLQHYIVEQEKARVQEEARLKAEANAQLAAKDQDAANERERLGVLALAGIGAVLVLAGAIGAAVLAWMHSSPLPGIMLLVIGILTAATATVIDESWFKWALGTALASGMVALVLVFKRTLSPNTALTGVVASIEEWAASNEQVNARAVLDLMGRLSTTLGDDAKKLIAKIRDKMAKAAGATTTDYVKP